MSCSCVCTLKGGEKTQRLATALHSAQCDLTTKGTISKAAVDNRLPTKKQLSFLQDASDVFHMGRYEWFLYLQIPSRLNGQLTLPNVIKYRALEADLVNRERWQKEKGMLLKRTQLPKLSSDPGNLISQMAKGLEIRLQEVSNYLEQDDNRNIILGNPKGKRNWRLPTANKKHLVNNPFFQQIPTTGVADVLRMVDRDTGFLDDFKHVLGAQSKSCAHEYDLLAILVGNATNQGIYGIAQISDRTYDQLSTIQANYLRLETLNAANDRINNATAKLPKDEEKIQIVKQASPVAWYNINLKGTYNFEVSEKLPELDELMRSIEGYLPVLKKYPPRET